MVETKVALQGVKFRDAGPIGVFQTPSLLAGTGSLVAGLAAHLAVRFLDKYFPNRKTTPYAVNCLVVGVAMTLKVLLIP